MKNKIISLVLAILMLLGICPFNILNAAEGESERLEVTPIEEGFQIDLTGLVAQIQNRKKRSLDFDIENLELDNLLESNADNYEKFIAINNKFSDRMAPSNITPETNPDDFAKASVMVDISDLLVEVLNITEVKYVIENVAETYHKEYIVKKDADIAKGEFQIGVSFEIDVPKEKPLAYVVFPDGRDARAAVEALTKNDTVNVRIGFVAHTGVEVKWHGTGTRPSNLISNYFAKNNAKTLFEITNQDVDYILRSGTGYIWAGHDNPQYENAIAEAHLSINDRKTANTISVKIKDKTQGQLDGSNYYFEVTGDALTGFAITMREKVSVDFDAGEGKWKDPATKPATQYTAYGLKVDETFMKDPDKLGPINVPDANSALTPPVEAGKPENEFKGWATSANGETVDFSTHKIEGNTTFYAIYGPKAQGKVNVKYVDLKTKKEIKEAEVKEGDLDTEVTTPDVSQAPEIADYVCKSVT
ncbi:MAG: hypothetical protein MR314_05660, partial [Ezakiella sp.]|nr:hypothetical protein [Ezakiella sp.]